MDGKWSVNNFPILCICPCFRQHARTVDLFLKDLEHAVNYVKEHPESANQGTTGVYGMVAKVPDKSIIDSFIIKFFGSIFNKGPTIGGILDQDVS